jgi:hypothetical protein
MGDLLSQGGVVKDTAEPILQQRTDLAAVQIVLAPHPCSQHQALGPSVCTPGKLIISPPHTCVRFSAFVKQNPSTQYSCLQWRSDSRMSLRTMGCPAASTAVPSGSTLHHTPRAGTVTASDLAL